MKLIVLRCPKCGYKQKVSLRDYNVHIRLQSHPYTCPNDYWEDADNCMKPCFDKHITLEIEDVYDE